MSPSRLAPLSEEPKPLSLSQAQSSPVFQTSDAINQYGTLLHPDLSPLSGLRPCLYRGGWWDLVGPLERPLLLADSLWPLSRGEISLYKSDPFSELNPSSKQKPDREPSAEKTKWVEGREPIQAPNQSPVPGSPFMTRDKESQSCLRSSLLSFFPFWDNEVRHAPSSM